MYLAAKTRFDVGAPLSPHDEILEAQPQSVDQTAPSDKKVKDQAPDSKATGWDGPRSAVCSPQCGGPQHVDGLRHVHQYWTKHVQAIRVRSNWGQKEILKIQKSGEKRVEHPVEKHQTRNRARPSTPQPVGASTSRQSGKP